MYWIKITRKAYIRKLIDPLKANEIPTLISAPNNVERADSRILLSNENLSHTLKSAKTDTKKIVIKSRKINAARNSPIKKKINI